MTKFISIFFLTTILVTGKCLAQPLRITTSNHLQMVLTTENGQLNLQTDKMRAYYDGSIGYFKFEVPLKDFEIVSTKRLDKKLYRSFKQANKENSLKILIYVEERPVDLDRFDGDGTLLSARIEFEKALLKGEATFWGRLFREHFLIKFQLHSPINKSISLFTKKKIPLKQIELYSFQTILFDFLGF